MHFELVFAGMLAIATVVAVVSRRFAMPFTVALVVAGLVLGLLKPFEPPHLTKDLLYGVFLPGLLFEASFHVPWRELKRNRLSVLGLALPGLVVAVALTAALLTLAFDALHLTSDFLFVHALVFGALIAATDPIAVTALFKSLGVSKRLQVLIEGESLINDGAALVVFALAVELASGGGFSAGHAVGQFVVVGGMGVAVGAVIGFAISLATRQIDEPLIEISLTTIAAYGAFAVAEHFGFSGVIATVVAGIVCGNYGARVGMSATTRVAVVTFWEYVAFAFNSFVFLLIGLEVSLADLAASWLPIVVAYLAVTVARAVVVSAVTLLLRRTRERLPWSWVAVLTWGGLRGALSMVMVLGLAADFPHRAELVTITFGVVLLSILVQGLTMTPLLKRLRIVHKRERDAAYEAARASQRATQGALAELDTLERERRVPADLILRLRAVYDARLTAADEQIAAHRLEATELGAREEHMLARHLLMVEKSTLLDAAHAGFIDHAAATHTLADVDQRLLALTQRRDEPSEEEEERDDA